jgi:glycosyltransferase involved in cell wall biosynthesis
MRILIIMDPGIMIPVKGYGGIERIIEMLALEHVKNGHEVHLLITEGSSVKGCTVHGFGKEGFPPDKRDAKKAIPVVWKFLLKHRHDFDLVHNFGRLIYLVPILNSPVKKIMSYQREINSRNILWADLLPGKQLFFTGCSQNLINRAKLPGKWEAVYNACDFDNYQLQQELNEEAPLIFLGRIEKIKGCHTAIEVAKATGNKLVIAGNVSTLPEEKGYFDKLIAPQIDGVQIRYIGAVNDAQKNEWLGKAKALLFPIEWNEPFGIVMIEAMACGTPVVAFNRGSVNEVIDEGITGYKVDTTGEMIATLANINQLSRTTCRQQAMKRFSVAVIARQYLDMVDNRRKKIVIVSTHQPAANPRALKEYDTLKAMGYSVKHLYAYNTGWSYRVDEEKFTKGIFY